MLKLDIRPGESFSIGDAIITLESKNGQIARLSVQADKSIPIKRISAQGAAKMAAEHGITAKT